MGWLAELWLNTWVKKKKHYKFSPFLFHQVVGQECIVGKTYLLTSIHWYWEDKLPELNRYLEVPSKMLKNQSFIKVSSNIISRNEKAEKSHGFWPHMAARRGHPPSLKLTFPPLKMDGWETSLSSFLLGMPICRGEVLVSGTVTPIYKPWMAIWKGSHNPILRWLTCHSLLTTGSNWDDPRSGHQKFPLKPGNYGNFSSRWHHF